MIKDIFGKVFTQKILKKDNELSKVQLEKNRLNSEGSLKVIAKMGLSFKSIAQEFKKISKGFSDLVKLEGGKPSEAGILGKDIADARANQQLFVRIPKKQDESIEQKEEGFSFKKFTDLLFNLLLAAVGSTIIAVSDIGTFISNTFEKVKTGFINFKDFVVTFDWYDYFKTGSIEFLHLVSLGLVSREKAAEVFDTLGSATRNIIDGIANFISEAKSVLVEETISIREWLALDVFGIDVYEVQTRADRKQRDDYIQNLKEDGSKLDSEIQDLNVKKETLVKRRTIWKEKIKKVNWERTDLTQEAAIYDPITGVLISGVEKDERGLGGIERKPTPAPVVAAPSPSPAPAPAPAPAPTPAPAPKTDSSAPKKDKSPTSGDEKMTYPTTKGQAVVTSKYGMRHIDGVGLHLHGGIDYAGVPEHSPIQILTSAKVVKAGKVSSLTSGYGNMIDLNVNGEILRFGHLSKMFVKEGEDVEKGKIIGLMGNTGQSYGAHLHFEHRSKSSFMDSATATFDPLKTGAPSLIAIGDKPVRLVADQNYSAFRKEVAGLDSQSSKIAQLYREQGRVSNPVVANVQKVNNMVVEKS